MLDEGVYTSVSEISDAENISKSYVSRILQLALLAPDIVDAILAGRTDRDVPLEAAGAAAAGELGEAACGLFYDRNALSMFYLALAIDQRGRQ
jgi:hypothetical protein